jgi:hypothetical protein
VNAFFNSLSLPFAAMSNDDLIWMVFLVLWGVGQVIKKLFGKKEEVEPRQLTQDELEAQERARQIREEIQRRIAERLEPKPTTVRQEPIVIQERRQSVQARLQDDEAIQQRVQAQMDQYRDLQAQLTTRKAQAAAQKPDQDFWKRSFENIEPEKFDLAGLRHRLTDSAQLREAILINEILAPPVSLR